MYRIYVKGHNDQFHNGLHNVKHATRELAILAAKGILNGQVARNNIACAVLVFKEEAELCISTGVEVKHTV